MNNGLPKPNLKISIPETNSLSQYSDTELLDWLQSKMREYTGKIICRRSSTGHGWRLHETSKPGGTTDIRQAIINAIEKEAEEN